MPVEGINPGQLESFNKEYAGSPSSFTLGIEGKTIWEGRGLGNLGKVGRWTLGGQPIEKPTRDFSVQLGSWKEVGDAIGVEGADDRIEPVETALVGLSSCVTEAIVLNCARTGVELEGLEVKAHADVDPGPIVGVKDPTDWDDTLQSVQVDVTARGEFSDEDRRMIEEGAKRSPVNYLFSRTGLLQTAFHYEGGRADPEPPVV
ncbi:MAG: OsmC family protein [Acidimicrobiia bacterium]